jgi:hypothetical protein
MTKEDRALARVATAHLLLSGWRVPGGASAPSRPNSFRAGGSTLVTIRWHEAQRAGTGASARDPMYGPGAPEEIAFRPHAVLCGGAGTRYGFLAWGPPESYRRARMESIAPSLPARNQLDSWIQVGQCRLDLSEGLYKGRDGAVESDQFRLLGCDPDPGSVVRALDRLAAWCRREP